MAGTCPTAGHLALLCHCLIHVPMPACLIDLTLVLIMQDIIPANVMIPPGRLRSLIEQALAAQGSAVACHDNRVQPNTSLFFDASASIRCLPISCTQILQDHRDQVLSVAFSPDGAWLASCSQDGRVGFWQVRTSTAAIRSHLSHCHDACVIVIKSDLIYNSPCACAYLVSQTVLFPVSLLRASRIVLCRWT